MATATYTKLKDGTWGVRVDITVHTVQAGSVVVVAKRDGTTKVETVERVLWTGVAKDGRQASLVQIAQQHRASTRQGSGASRRTGCRCGSREDGYGDLIPSPRNCASCQHDA